MQNLLISKIKLPLNKLLIILKIIEEYVKILLILKKKIHKKIKLS